MEEEPPENDLFHTAVAGLLRGDFSALADLFSQNPPSRPCQVIEWLRAGRFRDTPEALEEALTCACFLGETGVAGELLACGVDPQGGGATGMNALHWAVNRGQLETVCMLLERRPSLEVRNMYGGTVLDVAIWSAVHEPRPAHVAIIEALLKEGAKVDAVEYPTGLERIDRLLQEHGAKSGEGA